MSLPWELSKHWLTRKDDADLEYRFEDLIQVYLIHEYFKGWGDPLSTFHSTKFETLAELFGVEFRSDVRPDGMERMEHRFLWAVFSNTVDCFKQAHTPFSGFLECPRRIWVITEDSASRLGQLLKEERTEHLNLMLTIMKRLFADRPVLFEFSFTSRDLRARGFDDRYPPDPMDEM